LGFAVACDAFSFLENTRGKIASLPELPDDLVGRTGLHQSGRFLSASVESYVIKTGHGAAKVLAFYDNYVERRCRVFHLIFA
jgi:hypothetical protein